MWSCPVCGNHLGLQIRDQQMTGILCLHPDCGCVDVVNDEDLDQYKEILIDTDF